MLAKPISRRRFAGLLGAGIASAALRPGAADAAVSVAPAVPLAPDHRHLRVTVGTRPQRERFLGALDEVLAK